MKTPEDKQCVVCGEWFFNKRNHPKTCTCSSKCYNKLRYKKYIKPRKELIKNEYNTCNKCGKENYSMFKSCSKCREYFRIDQIKRRKRK